VAVALGAVAVLALGSAVAFGAIPNGDGNIYACYSNGDGSIRVHDDPSTPCAKGWSPLHWAAAQPSIPTTTIRLHNAATFKLEGPEVKRDQEMCNSGDIAITGGYTTDGGVRVDESQPVTNKAGDPIGWEFVLANFTGEDRFVTISVVCQHTETAPAN
jgi:hypothetical protein